MASFIILPKLAALLKGREKRGRTPGPWWAPQQLVCLLSCPLPSPKPAFSGIFHLASNYSVSCSPTVNIYISLDAGAVHADGTNRVTHHGNQHLRGHCPGVCKNSPGRSSNFRSIAPGICLRMADRKAVLFLPGEKQPVESCEKCDIEDHRHGCEEARKGVAPGWYPGGTLTTPGLKNRKGSCDLLNHGTHLMAQALHWAVNKQLSF